MIKDNTDNSQLKWKCPFGKEYSKYNGHKTDDKFLHNDFKIVCHLDVTSR